MPEKVETAVQELSNQEIIEETEEVTEEPKEHYEHMVDDAILGVMDDDENS